MKISVKSTEISRLTARKDAITLSIYPKVDAYLSNSFPETVMSSSALNKASVTLHAIAITVTLAIASSQLSLPTAGPSQVQALLSLNTSSK